MYLKRILTCVVILGLYYTISSAQSPKAERAESKAKILEREAIIDSSPLPISTGNITKQEVQAIDPDGVAPLDDPITCLSRTIYWEARGQKKVEMEAVANVVMNRLAHDDFPNTICKVVKQGQEQGACQFSWWCDGRSDDAEEESYAAAQEIARKVLNQQIEDRTDGATFFHHRDNEPSWSQEFIKTREIGDHIFYKAEITK